MDLLGYRSVLNEFDVLPLPRDPVGIERFQAAVDRAVRIRERMHASFDVFLTGHSLTTAMEVEIPPNLRNIVQTARSIKLISSPGPDHYILAASLAASDSNFPARSAYSLVVAVAAGMLVQLARGANDPADTLPLRGGIDIAAGVVGPPDDFLYSPSVVRAYELEGKAVYPRTIAGPRVFDFIESVGSMPGESFAETHAKSIALRMKDMFFVDSDGATVLDFYGDPIRRAFAEVEPARTLANQAWDYVRAAERAARAEGNTRVTEKYEWLLQYMASRRNVWV